MSTPHNEPPATQGDPAKGGLGMLNVGSVSATLQ